MIEIAYQKRKEVKTLNEKKLEPVVIDYGCGPGRYTLPIAKLVGPKGKVFAVDRREIKDPLESFCGLKKKLSVESKGLAERRRRGTGNVVLLK